MTKNIRKIDYCVYDIDKNFIIKNIDNKFQELTGYTKEDVQEGKVSQLDLIPKEDLEDYIKLVDILTKKNKEAYIEHRLVRKNGEKIYVFCLGIVENSKDRYGSIRVIRMDESLGMLFREQELKNQITDLESAVKTDDLTRLLRRDPFIVDVNNLINDKVKFALLLIDLDKFKNINDTYGHSVGDEVLMKVSGAFSKSVRKNDLIGRLGGDEFAVAIRYDKKAEIIEIVNRILVNVSSIKIKGKPKLKPTVSIGIKYYDTKGNITLYDELYIKADEALYKAKEKGRNTYCISK